MSNYKNKLDNIVKELITARDGSGFEYHLKQQFKDIVEEYVYKCITIDKTFNDVVDFCEAVYEKQLTYKQLISDENLYQKYLSAKRSYWMFDYIISTCRYVKNCNLTIHSILRMCKENNIILESEYYSLTKFDDWIAYFDDEFLYDVQILFGDIEHINYEIEDEERRQKLKYDKWAYRYHHEDEEDGKEAFNYLIKSFTRKDCIWECFSSNFYELFENIKELKKKYTRWTKIN